MLQSAYLYKSIRTFVLRMLLSFFIKKVIRKWINLTFFTSLETIFTFFWILRMISNNQSIKKHTHFFFTYALIALLLKYDTQMDNFNILLFINVLKTLGSKNPSRFFVGYIF